MKREMMSVLVGAVLLVPAEADAQRARHRGPDRGPRVAQPAPVTASGRLARCRAPAHARSFDCRSRVVYSSHAGHRAVLVMRPYRDARIRIRADWVRAPVRFSLGVRFDRGLNPGELRRMLGHRTVDRIRHAGRRAGLRGAPRGHWVDSRVHGLVLVVTMDRVDVAEFIDSDRDGFFDDSFLFRHDRRWVGWP